LAQVRLKDAHGLESGAIRVEELRDRLSPELAEEYRERAGDDGLVKLGLHDTYRLLHRLSDPLGKLFVDNGNQILDVLKVRNLSFLAHGFEPVGRQDFEKVNSVLGGFIRQGLEAVAPGFRAPRQLPAQDLMESVGLRA
jgi:hypothetical protein